MCSKTGLVLGLKGAKSVYNITASDRSQITVLLGMSASAHFLRPMIVFPGQRFTRNMLDGAWVRKANVRPNLRMKKCSKTVYFVSHQILP